MHIGSFVLISLVIAFLSVIEILAKSYIGAPQL